jgi:hypothetical protein
MNEGRAPMTVSQIGLRRPHSGQAGDAEELVPVYRQLRPVGRTSCFEDVPTLPSLQQRRPNMTQGVPDYPVPKVWLEEREHGGKKR